MGANEYLLAAGRLWFNDGGQAGNAGNGFLDIGNLPAISFTRDQTTLEHFVVVSGERLMDKSKNTSQKIGMSITLDEFSPENVNILLQGNGTTAAAQSGSSIVDESVTAPALLTGFDGGRSFFTAETNISAVTLTSDPAGTTYVLDTDYKIVSAATGEIRVLESGSIAPGAALLIDYTSAARTRRKIIPGKDLQIQGSARIELENPINGKAMTWKIQNCQLRIEGETAIDSENWSQATVILDILVDKDVTVSEPYGFLHIDV